jgi:hypothetical protein
VATAPDAALPTAPTPWAETASGSVKIQTIRCHATATHRPLADLNELGEACLRAPTVVGRHAPSQVLYTLHFISLAWLGVSWFYDAAQLAGWLGQASKQQPLSVCYSTWALTTPAYLFMISFGVFWVTLAWTVFVSWTTADNGLNSLLGILLLVGLAAGLVSCGGLHAVRSSRTAVESTDVASSAHTP